VQIVLAWAMLVAGHALWSWVAPRLGGTRLTVDAWGLGVLGAVLWAATWALPHLPASLVLPALVALTLGALRRGQGAGRARPAAARPAALAATVTLPAAAVATHALARPLPDWEANVVALAALGGPALWFWGGALLRALRPRGD
jgi:hypothetical protein